MITRTQRHGSLDEPIWATFRWQHIATPAPISRPPNAYLGDAAGEVSVGCGSFVERLHQGAALFFQAAHLALQ